MLSVSSWAACDEDTAADVCDAVMVSAEVDFESVWYLVSSVVIECWSVDDCFEPSVKDQGACTAVGCVCGCCSVAFFGGIWLMLDCACEVTPLVSEVVSGLPDGSCASDSHVGIGVSGSEVPSCGVVSVASAELD